MKKRRTTKAQSQSPNSPTRELEIVWSKSKAGNFIGVLKHYAKNQQDTIPEPDDWFIPALAQRLLRLGGKSVAIRPSSAVLLVHSVGHLMRFVKRKLIKGITGGCHYNVQKLWLDNQDMYSLAYGYALSDGTWREHSWLIDQKDNTKITETTVLMEMYFGLAMQPEVHASVFTEQSSTNPAGDTSSHEHTKCPGCGKDMEENARKKKGKLK